MSSLLAGLGMGVGVGSAYGTVTDILRTGITWGKWKTLGKSIGYPIMADILQKLLDADKDAVHGLSTKGMVDTIWSFIDRTLDFSWLVSESMANQLFVQMIQQSIAYAIHTSHAGAIGTVCNVYSGSQSLSGMSAPELGNGADLNDRGTKAFLSGATGLNIPSLAFEVNRGVNTRIGDVYNRILTQVDSLLDEWNGLALGYYSQYHTMARSRFQDALEMKEAILTKAYGFLEQVANEHLARISEQMDTLDGAKAWFDAGLLSSDELEEIALRVDIERQASEANFDDYKEEVLDGINVAVSDWDSRITNALNDLKSCEDKYCIVINSILSTLFNDVTEFARTVCDEADKMVEDVCAYRNVEKAVKITLTDVIGNVEMSPETEIYRLSRKKWAVASSYTVIKEYIEYSGVAWQSDTLHDTGIQVEELYTLLPRRQFESVDEPIVVYETQPTPLTPWESVE
jgi:hypothetical protein